MGCCHPSPAGNAQRAVNRRGAFFNGGSKGQFQPRRAVTHLEESRSKPTVLLLLGVKMPRTVSVS